jgi:hypothetical protein
MTTTTGLSEQKRTYLDVLAIAHYVYAALIALIGLAMMLMASIGLLGFAGGRGMHMGSGVERGLAGCLPAAFIGLAFLVVLAMAVVNFLAGRWLQQRRQWLPIVVVSVLNALNVPLGTLLGVFTIIVLVGDDVRAAFEGGGAASAAATVPPPTTGREL